jgi:hypothetical protein
MAFTSNNFLASDSHVFLRNQQHASRMFVDDQFRLAPKLDHLFHVAFNINSKALRSIDLLQLHRNEINMLVKSITLPKFDVTLETVNQYNRKKVIQSQHKFGDSTITFHDDNMGLVNQLWQNYYSYYYADSISAKDPSAYARNATKNGNYISKPYGLDNGSTAPFFNYITIYQMARHEYVSYKLINPMIKSFDHKNVSYNGATTLHENSMILTFEAVTYDTGVVNSDNVEGFGLEHYDNTPSPLSGLSDPSTLSPTFVSQMNVTNNAAESYSNTVTSINSYQNSIDQTATGTSGLLVTDVTQNVGGLQGITFPQAASSNNSTTVAKPINLNLA